MHKFARTWLSWIKVGVVIMYFLVIPFTQAPPWCTDYFSENPDPDANGWIVECEKVVVKSKYERDTYGQVRYSNIWMFKPVIGATLDIICVGYLTFFRFFKLTYREMSSRQRIRNYIMLFCFIVSLVALLQSVLGLNIVTLTFIVRPIVIVTFFSQVRARLVDILILTKQLLITLMAIFCFVLLSSFCGYIIFKSTFEGSSTCPDPSSCYY